MSKQPNPPPAIEASVVQSLAQYLMHLPACAKVAARGKWPYPAVAQCTCGLDKVAKEAGIKL